MSEHSSPSFGSQQKCSLAQLIIKYIKYNVKVLEKPIKAKDEAGTVKMLKAFIDGLVNAQKSLKLRGNFK